MVFQPFRSFSSQYPETLSSISGMTLCGWFRISHKPRDHWAVSASIALSSGLSLQKFQHSFAPIVKEGRRVPATAPAPLVTALQDGHSWSARQDRRRDGHHGDSSRPDKYDGHCRQNPSSTPTRCGTDTISEFREPFDVGSGGR